MSRSLRIEFPGAFYHIMSRGNEKQAIYKNRQDRLRFLDYLESASTRYAAVIHCYCLMNNHYHLLLETPKGNLAQIMRHINGSYSTYFNVRYDRVGHLFQGRYRSILVDVDNYFLALSRYIHLNPLEGKILNNPETYEWSSYASYLRFCDAPRWLRTDLLLSLMGGRDGAEESYRRFVSNGDRGFADFYDRKMPKLAVLGDAQFVEKVKQEHSSARKANRDLPAVKVLWGHPQIGEIVGLVARELQPDHRLTRKMSIYLCHQFGGCSLKDIGEYFGVGESAVTESSNRFAMTLYRDQRLAETVAGVLAELKM